MYNYSKQVFWRCLHNSLIFILLNQCTVSFWTLSIKLIYHKYLIHENHGVRYGTSIAFFPTDNLTGRFSDRPSFLKSTHYPNYSRIWQMQNRWWTKVHVEVFEFSWPIYFISKYLLFVKTCSLCRIFWIVFEYLLGKITVQIRTLSSCRLCPLNSAACMAYPNPGKIGKSSALWYEKPSSKARTFWRISLSMMAGRGAEKDAGCMTCVGQGFEKKFHPLRTGHGDTCGMTSDRFFQELSTHLQNSSKNPWHWSSVALYCALIFWEKTA